MNRQPPVGTWHEVRGSSSTNYELRLALNLKIAVECGFAEDTSSNTALENQVHTFLVNLSKLYYPEYRLGFRTEFWSERYQTTEYGLYSPEEQRRGNPEL